MSGATGESTRPVLGWVSLLWVAAAVSLPGSETVQTTPEVLASCGENVTLLCITSLKKENISFFDWVDGTKSLCNNSQADPEVSCKRTAEGSHYRLSLTLINVMPVNKSKYICKLRSTLEPESSETRLTVTSCLESSSSSSNNSHVQCNFTGVYPRGTVHWLHGPDNLTDADVTQEEVDEQGRFTITSSVATEDRNHSHPFNCSLWIPAEGRYATTIAVEVKSAGAVDKLLWICFLVEMMMLKSVT